MSEQRIVVVSDPPASAPDPSNLVASSVELAELRDRNAAQAQRLAAYGARVDLADERMECILEWLGLSVETQKRLDMELQWAEHVAERLEQAEVAVHRQRLAGAAGR